MHLRTFVAAAGIITFGAFLGATSWADEDDFEAGELSLTEKIEEAIESEFMDGRDDNGKPEAIIYSVEHYDFESAEKKESRAKDSMRPAGRVVWSVWMAPAHIIRHAGGEIHVAADGIGAGLDESVLSHPIVGAVIGGIIGFNTGSRIGGILIGAVAAPVAGGAVSTAGGLAETAASLTASIIETPLKISSHLPIVGRLFGPPRHHR